MIGDFDERDLFVYGLALYHGEGFKTEASGLGMANTSPDVLLLFVTWLRRFFEIDESRLSVRLYLHADLRLGAATTFWSDLLRIPGSQFNKPCRVVQRGTYRRSKHEFGCPSVRYRNLLLHRRVMAMIGAISSQIAHPG